MHLENFIIDANKPVHLAWWAEQFEVSEASVGGSNRCGWQSGRCCTNLFGRTKEATSSPSCLFNSRLTHIVAGYTGMVN